MATVVITIVTVDELLLGEGLEFPGGNKFSTLDGTGGGKSPAGTALLLVLDLRMCVFAVCAGV